MPTEYSAKMETSLFAALSATPMELEISADLNTGYNATRELWEIIIRYTGSLDSLIEKFPQIGATPLLGSFALLQIPRSIIDQVALLPNVIYMEKPRQLFYEVNNGRSVSCINSLQNETGLSGRGVCLGIIDSGIDYFHPDFRNEDGTTRILYLWDQTLQQIYNQDQLNAALSAPTTEEALAICPSVDFSGHGTHVAGIAAGNGRASSGVYRGVANEASLIIVKLASAGNGFSNTARLMEAIDFCIKKSEELKAPLVINLSYGNTYGSHSGTSLLESYIDYVSTLYPISIVVGSGNEADSGGHVSGRLLGNADTDYTQLSISEYTPTLSIQVWKKYWDNITFSLILPNLSIIPIPSQSGTYRLTQNGNKLYITVGLPTPYSIYQEIYIDLLGDPYLESGVWAITARGDNIIEGTYDMWLPSYIIRNSATRFLTPSTSTTLTIPSTAARVITVGAYDSTSNRLLSFSGRGYTWSTNLIKPELVAPGASITSCSPGGGYTQKSGTSMAAPFVSGSCALLMQWGIVEGNDPFLYGEKIKAALIRGSKKLPFENTYPSPTIGWGALCVRDSIP